MKTNHALSIRRRLVLLLLMTTAIACLVGCANGEMRPSDPFDRDYSFEEAQRRYTLYVRWSEFEKARDFVVPDARDAFIRTTKKHLKDARITDFESDDADLDAELRSATVRVTYTAYLPSSPVEMQIVEVQEWTRDGVGNHWRVKPRFEASPKVAAN